MKNSTKRYGAMLSAVAGFVALGLASTSYATITITGGNQPANDGSTVVEADPGECGKNAFNFSDYGITITTSTGGFGCQPGILGVNYPVGVQIVECTDGGFPEAKAYFTVTVVDTQFPVVTVPINSANQTDPGQCYATVNTEYNVSVADNCPGAGPTGCHSGLPPCTDPTVSCNPPPGHQFPVGTWTVSCIGIDGSGNKSTNTFPVIVTDQEAPVISCPSIIPPQVLSSCNGGLTVAGLGLSATDNCSSGSGITITCTPPLTSNFTSGVYLFRCNANDEANNSPIFQQNLSHSCVFQVPVLAPIGNVIWHAPIADTNCPGPGQSHSDVPGVYKFNAGATVPIQVHVVACGAANCNNGADITSTVRGFVVVQLVDQVSGDVIAELPEIPNGVGDPSTGEMALINGHLKFNLSTKNYPKNTVNNTTAFRVTIQIKDDPYGAVLGEERMLWESK